MKSPKHKALDKAKKGGINFYGSDYIDSRSKKVMGRKNKKKFEGSIGGDGKNYIDSRAR